MELLARIMPRVWPIPVELFHHHVAFTLAIAISRMHLAPVVVQGNIAHEKYARMKSLASNYDI